jgi:hypothetical protein
MGSIQNYVSEKEPDMFSTLTPEEAAEFWSPEAVAERERNAPESRE